MKSECTIDEMIALVEEGKKEYLLQLGHALCDEKRYQEAYHYYLIAAEDGNPAALRFICMLCWDNVLDDILTKEQQFHYFLQYHEKEGPTYITYLLAQCYKDGRGVEKDLAKYVEYLSMVAVEGFSTGVIELAECYEEGIGVEQDYAKAFDLYSHYIDEHCKPNAYCLYKEAYYCYHELGGAKKNLDYIKRLLLRSGKQTVLARNLYEEIFQEPFPKE